MYRLAAIAIVVAGCASRSRPATTIAPRGVGDWTSYNGSLSGERYSPLSEINARTVGRLQQECVFEMPDTVSLQGGIVAVSGILYFTAFNTTYAVDGATCQQKWKYTRPEPDTVSLQGGIVAVPGILYFPAFNTT